MADHRVPSLSRRGFLSASAAGVASLVGMSGVVPLLDPRRVLANSPHLVLGHDLSTLQQEEAIGHTFSDAGRVQPVERIVARHGATYVRMRLWVNPPWPWDDLPHVLAMARRIRDAGLRFLLDFHYSDFWADPGKQYTPQAWQGQDLPTLAQTVYDYTTSVLQALNAQGTTADIVQIGNEVTAGMLWPVGLLYPQDAPPRWTEFTTLLKAGVAAARDATPPGRAPRVMIHIDRGGDNGGSRWFYDHILQYGVDFDLIGLSYYPFYHGPLSALQANLGDLAPRYGKDIVVVETAYPWTFADVDGDGNIIGPGTNLGTPYPATPEGQLAYLQDVLSIILQTPGGHGLGMVYWEPAWIPGVGWEPGGNDGWDNMTLFDSTGTSLPGIRCFDGIVGHNH